MKRIAVNMDPIALIRNVFTKDIPDPAHMVVLAELGGAESIVCCLREDNKTVSERDIKIIKEISKTHLNVRCGVDAESIRKLLTIKPDMITFVAIDSKSVIEPQTVDLESFAETIGNLTADLRANDILSSAFIEPDINLVRLASKVELDYIEINTLPYSRAEDLDQQVAELENLNNVVIAANKLGMGVNASGGLNQEVMRDLVKISFLEDMVAGEALIVKSLAIGLEQAVRDFSSLI